MPGGQERGETATGADAGDVLINLGPDSLLSDAGGDNAAAGVASTNSYSSNSSASLVSPNPVAPGSAAAVPSSSTYTKCGSNRSLLQGLAGSCSNVQQTQQQQQHGHGPRQHWQQRQQQPPSQGGAAISSHANAPVAAAAAGAPSVGSPVELSLGSLGGLRRFSSQHFWLHDQPGEAAAAGLLHAHARQQQQQHGGFAGAGGTAMHGLLGGNAVSGAQAVHQIAYAPAPAVGSSKSFDCTAAAAGGDAPGGLGLGLGFGFDDEVGPESGSEGGSPTRQSLLRHAFGSFSSGSSSGSSSPLVGAAADSSSGDGRKALNASAGRQHAADSGSSGWQRPQSKSCSAAVHAGQQQQQQGLEQAGEGSGPEGVRHSSAFQRSKLRWQAAAADIMQMKKVASTFQPGGLQGLDVKRHNYDSWMGPLLHTAVNVTVTDFNQDQVRVMADISNETLRSVLEQPRPEWSRVRWVNVQGLSWDVIQTLAVAYNLHPLSVEDIVHIPQRIKADFYDEYLYASVLLLSVDHPSKLDFQEVVQTEVAAAAAAQAVQAARGAPAAAPQQLGAGGVATKAAAAALQRRCSLQRTGSVAAAAVEAAAKQPRLRRWVVPFGGVLGVLLRMATLRSVPAAWLAGG